MPEGKVPGRWSPAPVSACSLGKRWCVQVGTQKIPFEYQGNISLPCGWLLQISRQVVDCLPWRPSNAFFDVLLGTLPWVLLPGQGDEPDGLRRSLPTLIVLRSCEDACPAWLGPGVVLGYCVVVCGQVAWLAFGTGQSNLVSLIGCTSVGCNSRFTSF